MTWIVVQYMVFGLGLWNRKVQYSYSVKKQVFKGSAMYFTYDFVKKLTLIRDISKQIGNIAGLILFIGYTIRRLFQQNALSFVTIGRSVFYVDNALMIISQKRDVRIIQMKNIILYVVAVGSSSPTPFSYSSFSIHYPLGTNVTT